MMDKQEIMPGESSFVSLLTWLVVLLNPCTVTVIFFASAVVGKRDEDCGRRSASLKFLEEKDSLERELVPLDEA